MLVIDCHEIALGSAIIPTIPGVYSFYRKLNLESTSELQFLNSISKLTRNANEWPAFASTHSAAKPYVEVYPGRRRIGKRQDVIDRIKNNRQLREELRKKAVELSTFQQPLIIGESKNLNIRIKQHADGSRPIKGLQRFGLEFRDLVVTLIPTGGPLGGTRAEYLLELLGGTASIPTETLRL